MSTNVTLINNSLVKEYLTYNGQDVIVHSSLTDAGEYSMISVCNSYMCKFTNDLHVLFRKCSLHAMQDKILHDTILSIHV